jgi:hypothetical protein
LLDLRACLCLVACLPCLFVRTVALRLCARRFVCCPCPLLSALSPSPQVARPSSSRLRRDCEPFNVRRCPSRPSDPRASASEAARQRRSMENGTCALTLASQACLDRLKEAVAAVAAALAGAGAERGLVQSQPQWDSPLRLACHTAAIEGRGVRGVSPVSNRCRSSTPSMANIEAGPQQRAKDPVASARSLACRFRPRHPRGAAQGDGRGEDREWAPNVKHPSQIIAEPT